MLGRCALLGAAVFALFQARINEASAADAATDSGTSVYRQETQRHREALSKTLEGMTVERAFEDLQHNSRTPHSLLSFVRRRLVGVDRHRKRSHFRAQHRALQEPPADAAGDAAVPKPPADVAAPEAEAEAPKPPAAEAYGKDVIRAKDMLNDMIYETQLQYEIEHKKCCDYEKTKRSLIEETAQDISLFNAEAASARADILTAQSQISIAENRIPKVRDLLADHSKKCDQTVTSLKKELDIVTSDKETMLGLGAMAECKSEAPVLLQFGMMSCLNPCTREPHVLLERASERLAVLSLNSSAVRRLVQQALVETWDNTTEHPSASILLQEQIENELIADYNARARIAFEPRVIKPAGPCQKPIPTDKSSSNCKMGPGNCKIMQERLLRIHSTIVDKQWELQEEVRKVEASCTSTKISMENQINDFTTILISQQGKLAAATKKQNTADEQNRLKTVEKTDLQKEFNAMADTCHKNYESFEGQECGLKKLRGELFKMKAPGAGASFDDCTLSDWTPGTCSASCGGGAQQVTRTVVTAPKGGVKCLPLEKMQPCNTQKCPINCALADWESWSGCSAECGGGVMQRSRLITTRPQYGGTPCGESSDVRGCNLQSCNANCILGAWTAWSECSRGCGGGRQRRLRFVEEKARGTGKCPGEKDEDRQQYKTCNTRKCPDSLACDTSLDVILLLDGSSRLGADGFEAVKQAGARIVKALGSSGKTQVSTILFSGPESLQGYAVCSNEDSAAPAPDLAADCMIYTVSKFTTNTLALADKIEDLTWPAGSAMTSSALALAEAQLADGRKDASTVVLVITRGTPVSVDKTTLMARRLRQKARLMWVAVVGNEPLADLRKWSSDPDDENIIPVANFKALQSPDISDKVVAMMCPQVTVAAFPPTPLHDWDFRGCAGSVKDTVNNLVAAPKAGAECTDQGIRLDGKADYVDYDDFSWGGNIAIEVSVKYAAFNQWSRVFDCGEGPAQNDIYLANLAGSSAVRWEVNREGVSQQDLTVKDFWELGIWTHVVATFNGGKLSIYKNGVLAEQRTGLTEPRVMVRKNCWTGRSSHNHDGYFKGTVAYLRVWQHDNIGAENVREMYKAETSRYSYFVVYDGKVVLKTSALDDAKKKLAAYPKPGPERMICELVDGVVTMDAQFLGPAREVQDAAPKGFKEQNMLKVCQSEAQITLRDCELNPEEVSRNYSARYNDDPVGAGHARSKLNSVQAWSVKENKANEWMQIDIGVSRAITGVLVQGRADNDQRVTSFKVQTSVDGKAFTDVGGVYNRPGKDGDGNVVSRFFFPSAVVARYVRFVVLSWNSWASMRAGVSTCKAR